jgi:hypothetical protein
MRGTGLSVIGGAYGGGAELTGEASSGAAGTVRIILGTIRAFPSTNTGDS